MFDKDRSGYISKTELVEIMSLLVGTHVEASQIETIVDKIASHCDVVDVHREGKDAVTE